MKHINTWYAGENALQNWTIKKSQFSQVLSLRTILPHQASLPRPLYHSLPIFLMKYNTISPYKRGLHEIILSISLVLSLSQLRHHTPMATFHKCSSKPDYDLGLLQETIKGNPTHYLYKGMVWHLSSLQHKNLHRIIFWILKMGG
jgi:hypothetical protein